MPNTTCVWVLAQGTRGQSSAIFYENQNFFFVAKEDCGDDSGRTALLSITGPWCNSGITTIYARGLAYFKYMHNPLDTMNLAWDHTCNVVVITPNDDESGFVVNQVSEYDGQQRFQPTYTVQNGWKKKYGVGALDFGDFRASWPVGNELYCGDLCLFYSLEEKQPKQDGEPLYLIGRTYRSGIVKVNLTDSVQIQTLSWNPFITYTSSKVNQFIGIGKCCSDSWCHPDCKNFGENLVLVNFLPQTGSVSILAEIGEVDMQTINLGVEFSAPVGPSFSAYVLHKNSVVTFDLVVNQGVILKATKQGISPPVEFNVVMWANAGII